MILLSATMLSSFVFLRKPPLLVVFIGDSITQGAGLSNPLEEAPPIAARDALRGLPGNREVLVSNQGVSGFTTVDFLPSTATVFGKVIKGARELVAKQGPGAQLLFSIMLGTNDSAGDGPNGSPVSPDGYKINLATICDSLLKVFPDCKIIINRPVWYSPNTYNGARYLAEGLARLKSYFPKIDELVSDYSGTHPGHVYTGDKKAFTYFEKNYHTDLNPEQGRQGTFFLHPNKKGAAALGRFWAHAISKAIE